MPFWIMFPVLLLLAFVTPCMFLSLPVVAVSAMARRWRQRRGAWAPGLALLAWGAEVVAAIEYFLSGRWYGEGGGGISAADVAQFALIALAVAVPWVVAVRALQADPPAAAPTDV